MKRKDSNCVGILSDQGEADTASNLSVYTIMLIKNQNHPDFVKTRFLLAELYCISHFAVCGKLQ